MKNYQYVLDIETPFIKKLYDKEDDYKVELLTPYGILEELKKLQEENADLETKLAESEKNVKVEEMLKNYGKEEIKKLHKRINEIVERDKNIVMELKQQLAEKDEENNELVFIIEEIEQFAWEQLNNENFDRYKAYDEMLTKIKQLTKNSPYENLHQDKISFAVEQLELARRKIDCLRYNENKCLNKKDCIEDCLYEIDNQIEELKKEMKWYDK